jgi:type IV pilus assembly protein PilC
MPSFAYSAINAQGFELAGEIQAADLGSARDALRSRGLMTQTIRELAGTAAGAESGRKFLKPRVKAKSLQIFSRQFATMIEAGLSVVSALVILEQQTDDKALKGVIDDVREHVESGALLSEAMGRHP